MKCQAIIQCVNNDYCTWQKEAAKELERQAKQCPDDNVMGITTKKIVELMKQIEPFLQ